VADVPAKKVSAAEVIAFMECVMEAVGVSRPVDLENLLTREGVLESSEARKLYRWKNGQNGPNFQSTMRLLRRAGFLTPEALACLDRYRD
jgi:hypothetical protein